MFLIQHLLHKLLWCCLCVTKLCVVERDILTIEIPLLWSENMLHTHIQLTHTCTRAAMALSGPVLLKSWC